MRVLWSLPKAAPAILRHLLAYVELAVQDLQQTRSDFKSRLVASAVLLISVVFLIFSLCLTLVALTWDTPYRVTAIAWMTGFFFFVALVSALYRGRVIGVRAPFLGTVRREWAEDRVILERILSETE